MKLNLESTEPDVRIEIVPLIDVIFCILTFFILAAVTLTRQSAINVDLPRAATGATQLREILIVSVDPIGQIYLEKTPVSREQLYQAILNFRQTNPEGVLALYASRAASYNDVVQVLDLLRAAGGERVALATLPDGGNGQGAAPSGIPNLDQLSPSPPGATNDLFELNPSPGLGTPTPNSPNLPGDPFRLPASPNQPNSGTAAPRTSPDANTNAN
ncbi:MAG: biopolymer transporter ExbD [Synechococcales cyanobacterium M58_A2018_015]|nr:biopolymer transporter ExbD [Synechococcales cyanobacterium M58_A2018_015]